MMIWFLIAWALMVAVVILFFMGANHVEQTNEDPDF